MGGLGNQMFQYAAGRRLAYFHNTDLFLDVTWFSSQALRKYELDVFKINAAIARLDFQKNVSFSRKDRVRLGIRKLFTGETVIQYVKEESFNFHEKVLSLPDNSYLDGYWQSEKYFAEIADSICKELSFVNQPSKINKKLLDDIKSSNSVSLHVRRGDYISNPKNMEIHGVLGAEYYRESLNLINENVIEPEIFVFSDDIVWAKENLIMDLPVHFIDQNRAENDHEDLRLMSNCKHHIIANSSFSWWGAWLSTNPKKFVIAPKKWFNLSNKNIKDLIPASWHQI
jgi:hypothetical protein